MPILDITLLSGRSYDKKAKLIREVTDATVRALDVPPDSVRVILREGIPRTSPSPANPKDRPTPDGHSRRR